MDASLLAISSATMAGSVSTGSNAWAGSGPPLVFLHGAMGLTWDPFLDALVLGEAGGRIARLDQDATHAEVSYFVIQRLGIALQCMLACSVNAQERRGQKSEHRAHENDAAAPCRPHVR